MIETSSTRSPSNSPQKDIASKLLVKAILDSLKDNNISPIEGQPLKDDVLRIFVYLSKNENIINALGVNAELETKKSLSNVLKKNNIDIEEYVPLDLREYLLNNTENTLNFLIDRFSQAASSNAREKKAFYQYATKEFHVTNIRPFKELMKIAQDIPEVSLRDETLKKTLNLLKSDVILQV